MRILRRSVRRRDKNAPGRTHARAGRCTEIRPAQVRSRISFRSLWRILRASSGRIRGSCRPSFRRLNPRRVEEGFFFSALLRFPLRPSPVPRVRFPVPRSARPSRRGRSDSRRRLTSVPVVRSFHRSVSVPSKEACSILRSEVSEYGFSVRLRRRWRTW